MKTLRADSLAKLDARKRRGGAQFTSEAKYGSASKCSDEVLWVRRILFDSGASQVTMVGPTPRLEDNRACRMLGENPIQSRSRHIDFRVMSLRERVADGTIHVLDCPAHDMHADNLTKNLTTPTFIRHRDVQIGTMPATSPSFALSPPSIPRTWGGAAGL